MTPPPDRAPYFQIIPRHLMAQELRETLHQAHRICPQRPAAAGSDRILSAVSIAQPARVFAAPPPRGGADVRPDFDWERQEFRRLTPAVAARWAPIASRIGSGTRPGSLKREGKCPPHRQRLQRPPLRLEIRTGGESYRWACWWVACYARCQPDPWDPSCKSGLG